MHPLAVASTLAPRARIAPLLVAAAACLAVAAAHAATAPRPTAAAAASAERIRAHVGFLADDLLEGRAAGSKGYDLAARYVATQFELLGLKPAGVNGTWYQPIEFLEASP